jgi:hypothetical protein
LLVLTHFYFKKYTVQVTKMIMKCLACPYDAERYAPECFPCGLWHKGNMGISGEALCHIPSSNVFAGFLSEYKPCHIYYRNERLLELHPVPAE